MFGKYVLIVLIFQEIYIFVKNKCVYFLENFQRINLHTMRKYITQTYSAYYIPRNEY